MAEPENISDGPALAPTGDLSVAVLCGGVGAARFLQGLMRVMDPTAITAVVNVADDVELHGLHVSPDIDTIVYTLAGAHSAERGWGLDGETWQAMETLARYGGRDWFSLGDRDLGTHLYRTDELNRGRPLSDVTDTIARAWGLDLTVLPVTNDRLRTMITTVDEGEIGFQEYFVRRRHDVAVSAVRFDGAVEARPAPGVLEALTDSDVVVIAPSNPVVSIDPILAVPGIRAALAARSGSVVAISPIVGGRALKGPADRMLVELGREASVDAVGQWYADICSVVIIDQADADQADKLTARGLEVVVTDTIMSRPGVSPSLARSAINAAVNR